MEDNTYFKELEELRDTTDTIYSSIANMCIKIINVIDDEEAKKNMTSSLHKMCFFSCPYYAPEIMAHKINTNIHRYLDLYLSSEDREKVDSLFIKNNNAE